MSDEKPAEMVFSERAYKVVLALNAEYGAGMEGQPATEMIELAIAAAVAEEREACAVLAERHIPVKYDPEKTTVQAFRSAGATAARIAKCIRDQEGAK